MTVEFKTLAAPKGTGSEQSGQSAEPRYSPEAYLLAVILGVGIALCALASMWG
jgi:hypothetical protein